MSFRWAIAGLGKVAAGGHHHGIQRNGHTLAGFTTSDPAIRSGDAGHVKFNWGTSGLTFDVSGLIVSEKPDDAWLRGLRGKADAVIVCVPTRLHREIVERVLRAGFDCLVEKPFAETAAEAWELMQLAANLERKLLVAQVLPAFQEFGALRAAILQKGLGQLNSLSLRRLVPWKNVSAKDEIAGSTGYFADLAVHDAHFLASLGHGVVGVHPTRKKYHHERLQYAVVGITLATYSASVTIDVGAKRNCCGDFEQGFDAVWSDGSMMSFENGEMIVDEKAVALESQSVGDIFGLEVALAAEHFRDGKDPGYLAPDLAYQALRIIESV